jgi:hypothetical protein
MYFLLDPGILRLEIYMSNSYNDVMINASKK